MKSCRFDIDDDLMIEMKLYCVKNKTTIKQFVTELIEQKLKESENDNDKTANSK